MLVGPRPPPDAGTVVLDCRVPARRAVRPVLVLLGHRAMHGARRGGRWQPLRRLRQWPVPYRLGEHILQIGASMRRVLDDGHDLFVAF